MTIPKKTEAKHYKMAREVKEAIEIGRGGQDVKQGGGHLLTKSYDPLIKK